MNKSTLNLLDILFDALKEVNMDNDVMETSIWKHYVDVFMPLNKEEAIEIRVLLDKKLLSASYADGSVRGTFDKDFTKENLVEFFSKFKDEINSHNHKIKIVCGDTQLRKVYTKDIPDFNFITERLMQTDLWDYKLGDTVTVDWGDGVEHNYKMEVIYTEIQ